MHPVRCFLALSLILSCTSNSTLTTDPGCVGVACVLGGDGGPTGRDGGSAGEPRHEQIYDLNPVRDIDILFLVDNSPSMKEEQDKLRANFSVFMDELKKIPGGLPNVHIGVVSSDLGAASTPLANGGCPRPGGDRGIFQTKANCGLDPGSLFISSFNNQTVNNFQGTIDNAFSCMANLGVQGCGYEHQLQATRVALYESITPENKGFLRQNAFLALILITDEDDCSANTTSDLFTDDATFPGTSASFRCAQVGHVCDGKAPPVGEFSVPLENCKANDAGRLIKVNEIVDSIRQLKQRPDQQILVSGIIGWPRNTTGAIYRYAKDRQNNLDVAPICMSANGGDAYAGLRLKQFVESFGASGSFFSICDEDFSPAMKQIGGKLAAKLGNMCISAPVLDTAPDPGVQPDCQVVDRVPEAGGFKDEPLPPCGSGRRSASGACWQLVADMSCDASGFKLNVDRGGKLPVPGAQQVIRCLTCSKAGDPRCGR
jgi:hypothetical protein